MRLPPARADGQQKITGTTMRMRWQWKAAATILAVVVSPTETPAQRSDQACLACHGEKDVQALATKPGRNLFVDRVRLAASVHGGLSCVTCHTSVREFPHPARMPRVQCSTCHAEPSQEVPKSTHAILGAQACSACHGPPHEIGRAPQVAPERCADCHGDAVRDYGLGVHGQARGHGDPQAATCLSCHGSTHGILPATVPNSPVAKKNLPATCGACHANPAFLARHRISFARPVEAYRLSVHGRAVERGNPEAPSCSSCHANHAIFPARDPRSRINHWKVAETCGVCHAEIQKTFERSTHGQAVARGVSGAPVCTDCHGEHAILAPSEPLSLVNPARVSTATCARCHADERLAQRYNLPLDKVPAFEDSYHGLALRAGSQTVANCASCHGVHNILASSDPRSTIHPANLAATCGACHPGAGERFSIGPVHVRPATASEHLVVRWIRVAYLVLIPVTVGFMLLHNALDLLTKLVRGTLRGHSGETVPRMNLHFRVAHWLVMGSFPVLIATGFALKFPESWWAAPLLRWESQYALRGTVHRTAGVILIAALFYHLIHLLASRRDRLILRFLKPSLRDLRELTAVVRYNLACLRGRGRTGNLEPPVFGKFSYAEKFEYWAFVWGTVVMAVSGLLLWFNDFTLRWFPKWVSDAATAIHYYEAILATLAILLWHFYMVMFDPDVYPMDLSWLTGRASAEHLRHTRPEYYLTLAGNRGEEAQRPQAPLSQAGSQSASSSQDDPSAGKQAQGEVSGEKQGPPED